MWGVDSRGLFLIGRSMHHDEKGLVVSSLIAAYFYTVLPSSGGGSGADVKSVGAVHHHGSDGGGDYSATEDLAHHSARTKSEYTPLLGGRNNDEQVPKSTVDVDSTLSADALMDTADAMFARNATPLLSPDAESLTRRNVAGTPQPAGNDGRRSVNFDDYEKE